MQLAGQYDGDFLLLLNHGTAAEPDSGRARLTQLLADEPSRLTAGTDSELAFHTACVQLLADCCVGAEAELSVKAMGYMTLSNVVDVVSNSPYTDVLRNQG